MAVLFVDLSGTSLPANATFLGGTANGANGTLPGGATVASVGSADGIGSGTGQARDAGAVAESDRFGAIVHSDQAGTLYIDGAFNRVTQNWRQLGSVAVVANTPVDLDIPVRFPLMRVRYVNGATATTAGLTAIHSSFRR